MSARSQNEAMLPDFRAPSSSEDDASPASGDSLRGKFVPDEAQDGFERTASLEATTAKEESVPKDASKASAAKGAGEWREEVAARLNRYREKRRPQAPRYPSLTLKFDPPELSSVIDSPIAVPDLTVQSSEAKDSVSILDAVLEPAPEVQVIAHETAKVIEFPRPWVPQVRPADELAEPVLDRPRIIEVPEILPPPPALGGMLIEDVQEHSQERLPGFDIPLQAAPLAHRLIAGAMDGLLVGCGFGLFGYVASRITTLVIPIPQLLGVSAAMLWLFWAGYQYLMTVYTGSTPGLKFAKLQLSRFDGTPAPQKIRKWRALASILSAASIAMGYAWCFLDEDGLCWHDRITKTYIAPQIGSSQPGSSARV